MRRIFDAWVGSLPGASQGCCQLTKARREAIRARLAENYTEEDLIAAVRGWVNDPWPERRRHNELAILLRDGGQVEKFRGLHGRPAPALMRTGPRSQVAELRAQGSDDGRRARLAQIDAQQVFVVGERENLP
ncbi:MAG TPA: hypothetical protein VKU44_01170 [Terriglobia bacterium]|nr:hypothetical protein [Terriglobia bacterium]